MKLAKETPFNAFSNGKELSDQCLLWSDHTQEDLASNFFVLCTNMKVLLLQLLIVGGA